MQCNPSESPILPPTRSESVHTGQLCPNRAKPATVGHNGTLFKKRKRWQVLNNNKKKKNSKWKQLNKIRFPQKVNFVPFRIVSSRAETRRQNRKIWEWRNDSPPRKKENKLVSATDGGLFVLHHGGYFSENIYRMAPFPLRDQSLQNRHTNLWSYQREKNTGSSPPPPYIQT